MKRRTAREVIESTSPSEVEHTLVKYPTKEPIDISLPLGGVSSTVANPFKLNKFERGSKPYTHIHTHPSTFYGSLYEAFGGTGAKRVAAIPSGRDFDSFLRASKRKVMVIAVRDSETGKVLGYNVIRKTKKTPEINPEFNWKGSFFDRLISRWKYESEVGRKSTQLLHNVMDYSSIAGKNLLDSPEKTVNAYKEFLRKYHLQSRLVPMPEYKVNDIGANFGRKSLEKRITSAVAIGSFAISALFLSTNLTGNAIASLNQISSNWIGEVLFLVGLIGAFLYFRRR